MENPTNSCLTNGEHYNSVKESSGKEQVFVQKVVQGGLWVFALRIVEQCLSLIKLIILARILAPHDFGLMGIALLTMAILDTFSQTGFQLALIQKKENIQEYLDSAWTVMLIRGFILFIILYLIAPYAAIFFNAPEAKFIIQVVGVSLLFQAFTNISIVYFQKELEFNKQFIYQGSGIIVDFIVAVSSALILKNVWAIVFGLLAGDFVRFIVSYLIHPYRPHISLDLKKIRELFRFGKWIFASSVVSYLLSQGDDIFVGKLLGVTMLGFYRIAYRVSNIPTTEITTVISQVTFPAYSKLQDDLPRLKDAYLRVLQFTAFLSFPIAGMIFVFAPEFTITFLGEKWMPMVPAMQVLCILGAIRSIVATMGAVFYSIGKPKIRTQLSIMQLLIMVSLIYPLTAKWGIVGTSTTVVLTNIASYWGVKQVLFSTKCKLRDFSRSLFSPLLSIFITVFLLFLLNSVFESNIVNFLFQVGLYVFSYLILTYLLDKVCSSIYGGNFKIIKDLLLTQIKFKERSTYETK